MSSDFIRNLAWTFLAGPWKRDALVDRIRIALRRASCPIWASTLCDRLVFAFGHVSGQPRFRDVEAFLRLDAGLQKRFRRWDNSGLIPTIVVPRQKMVPANDRLARCCVPRLVTTSDVAAWLSLSPGELDWFADVRQWERKQFKEALKHYRYQWIPKKQGVPRLLESPKPRLKAIQRRMLDEMLSRVPIHDAAHGFCRERSVKTYLKPHTGRDVVLTIDLRHFFPSVQTSKVNAIFRTIGYPESVARILTRLCTNSVPENVLRAQQPSGTASIDDRTASQYRNVHLPQGAPTSPVLANLAACRLDRRLAGLARKFGAGYTRYADDLTFSGDATFQSVLPRFQTWVGAIVLDEGFALRHRKTRIMTQGNRQRVTGLVINQHLNIPRRSYDELKAILYNCVRFGPSSQNQSALNNFDAHLAGRIEWVHSVNPRRAVRLQALFDQIDWSR